MTKLWMKNDGWPESFHQPVSYLTRSVVLWVCYLAWHVSICLEIVLHWKSLSFGEFEYVLLLTTYLGWWFPNTSIYIYIYIYIHIYTYIYIYMYSYMYMHMHTCIHACMHACIHTYIFISPLISAWTRQNILTLFVTLPLFSELIMLLYCVVRYFLLYTYTCIYSYSYTYHISHSC